MTTKITKEKALRVNDTASFIKKAKVVHGDKYTYKKSIWTGSRDKIIVTCPIHGDFLVRAANFTTKKPQGCKGCHFDTKRKTNDQYLIECQDTHGDTYDLSNVEYKGAKEPVTIICKSHGEFIVAQAANFTNGSGCPTCSDAANGAKKRNNVDDLINSFYKTHNQKYAYPDLRKMYTGMNDKIKIVCPEHGEFTQLANAHYHGSGCAKCSFVRNAKQLENTTDEYVAKCIAKFGNKFDYSQVELGDSGIRDSVINITCMEHDTKCIVSAKAHLNSGATNCISCMAFNGVSKEEQDVLDFVTSCLPEDVKIISSDNQTIKPKQIDIHIPSLNIAFEYCGVYWHQEAKGKNSGYHLAKTEACEAKGIRLIQIFSSEWNNKREIVKSRIATILHAVNVDRQNARSLNIREISNAEKTEFLNRTHIQGDAPASFSYGLVDKDDKIYSIMTFGKARYNKSYEYELIRFSSELNCIVRGAASKLFKHFVATNSPETIVSYSDKRWNTGDVYAGLGFDFIHTSKPNYFYFHELDVESLKSRVAFQKHKLEKLLETFDPNMSEADNMKANGYGKIWDCGNSLFLWASTATIAE